MLSTFLESLDVDSVRVYSPRTSIFVCGGKQAESPQDPPESLRDIVLRNAVLGVIPSSRIFVVEKIQREFLLANVYADFYEFENDVAQICDLVFLISESPGSFTELGSFTRDIEVARKLFAVIRSAYFDDGSYISVGPLRHLDKYYPGSVFVISDSDYAFDADDLSRFRTDRLAERIKEPIDAKIASAREHTKFDRQRRGHLCKFLTALVQEFGALQMPELAAALEALGIHEALAVAEKMIFCAKTMEWVRTDRRGLRTFILPGAGNRAAKFTFLNDDIPADSNRRRFEMREYWSTNDEERSTAIRENTDVLAEGVEQ